MKIEESESRLIPKKILIVYGTRPEAIKLAPIILQLRTLANFETIVCVTAQHRELLDQVNELFDIVPDFDLNIMKTNQSLQQLTASVLNKFTPIIRKISPD